MSEMKIWVEKGQVCFLATVGSRSKVGNKWKQDKQSPNRLLVRWKKNTKMDKSRKGSMGLGLFYSLIKVIQGATCT